ncbi:4096_t:CDS:2 [Dentiscutata heterogama]|uniref:4096_t:CDS:1 n=1 Tax=Dentiscutata heterogama TaxID=1316150 RepID=A0ACA9KYD6_9GLOM|nr:4096_t:CDS:2 [Dentiscutata heterogama]
MSYFLQSNRFLSNQQELYPERLVEDSVTESMPDAPPSYQEAVAEMPTGSFSTATSDI